MSLLDNKERLGSLLILLFAAAYLRQALELPVDSTTVDGAFTSRTLPIGLSTSAIVLSIVQFLFATHGSRVSVSVADYDWRSAALLVLAMAVYALSFEFLGFVVSSVFFLLAGFAILGERNILRSGVIASVLVAVLWALFTKVFDLYLESGAIYRLVVAALS